MKTDKCVSAIKKNGVKLLMRLTVIVVVIFSFILGGCTDFFKKNVGKTKEYIDRDAEMYFSVDKCYVQSLPYAMATDANQTYIKLSSDGTFCLKITLLDNFVSVLSNFGYDLNKEIKGINIKDKLEESVVYSILPGFDLDDLKGSAELLEKSLGLKITGIDFNDEKIVKLQNSIKETGMVPEDFVIPEGLGIELNETYEIKNFVSETTGETFKAVYVGKHSDNCEPYIVMTLYTDANGKYKITYNNKIVDFILTATETGYTE